MLIHELNHVKWDVVGLAETHWTGVVELTYKDIINYIFIYMMRYGSTC